MRHLFIAILITGCSSGSTCVPGQTISCACSGGATGVQTCQTGGSYGSCDCGNQQGQIDFGVQDLAHTGGGSKKIFATSGTYSSNLKMVGGGSSGLDGADKLCGNVAAGAGFTGSYIAWLSDDTHEAISRVSDVGPWFLVTGEKVFNNKAGMTGTPLVAIDITQNGQRIMSSPFEVWTGTHTGGTRAENCNNWTGAQVGSDVGTVGATDDTTVWTETPGSNYGCAQNTARLFCIEQ